MDDNVNKTCVSCNIESCFEVFQRKNLECKECKTKRVLKRYCIDKNEILQ